MTGAALCIKIVMPPVLDVSGCCVMKLACHTTCGMEVQQQRHKWLGFCSTPVGQGHTVWWHLGGVATIQLAVIIIRAVG